MGEFRCLPASSSSKPFCQNFQPTSLACLALTMQEATNISIDAGMSQRDRRDSNSGERLTPSLARVTSGTPVRDFLAMPSSKDDKGIKSEAERSVMASKKVVSPDAGSVERAHPDLESTVDSITFPVMCMSIDDALPQPLDGDGDDDSNPLTASSFREAYSTAEAVTSFLDRQFRTQYDTYGYGRAPAVEPPPTRRGRFQRRNSFVIHNKKRSRSLEGGDVSVPGGDDTAASTPPPSARKPRFDMRSQSEGTLMRSTTTTPVEPPVGLHRLSLPWKRKKGESHPGPASPTDGK